MQQDDMQVHHALAREQMKDARQDVAGLSTDATSEIRSAIAEALDNGTIQVKGAEPRSEQETVLTSGQIEFVARRVLEILNTTLEEMIQQAVERRLAGPVLDNYSGFVNVLHRETAGGTGGELVVFMSPTADEFSCAEKIEILEGNDAEEVSFELHPDSDDFDFSMAELKVKPGEVSEEVVFPFKYSVDKQHGEYKIWVQVFQRNRLIQVVPVTLIR